MNKKDLWREVKRQREELDKISYFSRACYFIAVSHATSLTGLNKCLAELMERYDPDQLLELCTRTEQALLQTEIDARGFSATASTKQEDE